MARVMIWPIKTDVEHFVRGIKASVRSATMAHGRVLKEGEKDHWAGSYFLL